jgi:Na+/proline symporter
MENINTIDVALVLSYLIGCLILGFTKFDQIKNIRDYTLGSRPFTTTVLTATTFATAISAHKTIGSVGKSYSMGLVFILSMFLIPIGWFVMARLLSNNLKFFHQKKFLTLGEIMEYWYGKSGKWLTCICAIAFTLGITAGGSIAIGKMAHYFFHINQTLAMLLALGIVTLYSTIGGIKAVAITDVFQFLIFFIVLPIACAIGYNNVGGYQNIINSLPHSHLTIGIDDIALFLGMAGFALMPNADIPFIQRALVSSNTHQLKSTFNAVAVLMFPLFFIIALIGLITYTYNPNLDPDTALYFFTQNYLPSGVIGLMISGILAIVMSTQDSFLNTTSTLIARDICKQIWPDMSDKRELMIARLSCIVIAIMSISLLFITDNILDLIWFIANFWDPLIIVPFIGCLIGVRINKKFFFVLPITVLIAEIITSWITGAFDSRSFTVGIIVSTITLYFISKIGKKIKYQLI